MVQERTNEAKLNNASCLYSQYCSTGNVELLHQAYADIIDVVSSGFGNEKASVLKSVIESALNKS